MINFAMTCVCYIYLEAYFAMAFVFRELTKNDASTLEMIVIKNKRVLKVFKIVLILLSLVSSFCWLSFPRGFAIAMCFQIVLATIWASISSIMACKERQNKEVKINARLLVAQSFVLLAFIICTLIQIHLIL